MIGRIEATLRERGVARNTYLVFSSDNGYHMGDHRLMQGKMTAFDTDIGVPAGRRRAGGPGRPDGGQADRNIDLRPTFSQLAGADVPASVDGHSLVPLLHGAGGGNWRIADAGRAPRARPDQGDPDFQSLAERQPDDVRGDSHAGRRLRRVHERRSRVLRPRAGPVRARQHLRGSSAPARRRGSTTR